MGVLHVDGLEVFSDCEGPDLKGRASCEAVNVPLLEGSAEGIQLDMLLQAPFPFWVGTTTTCFNECLMELNYMGCKPEVAFFGLFHQRNLYSNYAFD